MERPQIYNIPADVSVIGVRVDTFPNGIGEAFEKLAERFGGFNRPFYGLSIMRNGQMNYYAMAHEQMTGEAERWGFTRMTIEKGEYMCVRIVDWQPKTDSIKGVFMEMMSDPRIDKSSPAVEWYKDDSEMFCMLKVKVN